MSWERELRSEGRLPERPLSWRLMEMTRPLPSQPTPVQLRRSDVVFQSEGTDLRDLERFCIVAVSSVVDVEGMEMEKKMTKRGKRTPFDSLIALLYLVSVG